MARTLNERRAEAALKGPVPRSSNLPGENVSLISPRAIEQPAAGAKSPSAAERAELRAATNAVRQAQRELRHWETMFDSCCKGDPNRYIAEIRAAEGRVEAARAALRKLSLT